MKTFSDNYVKCNVLLIDWIVGIIKSILQHPLDTPEWSLKKYPIFIPRSEVPPLEMTSTKKLTQIPCSSLNEDLDQLVWIFKVPQVSIPILVKSAFNQPLSIPILAVCKSNKRVNIFTKKKNRSHYILKKKFCSRECPTVTTFLTYISPLIPDTQLPTVSTEGIDSSSSRQRQDTDPSHLERFLAKHILDSTQQGMSSVLIRMDDSGYLRDMKKITLEENIFILRNFIIKTPTQACVVKSEGHQNTTGPCSELTKTKLKERLEGKDAAIIISEDDGNNSFLHKSEGQDKTTEHSTKIREKCDKDETTEDNTDMFDTEVQQRPDKTDLSGTSGRRDHTNEDYTEITKTFGTNGETIQEGTHLSETSERRDDTNEDYTEITKTFGTNGETIQEGTHLSETSQMRDEIKEDYTEITNTFGTEGETTQDGTDIYETSETQGSTNEDNRKMLNKEDRKETSQSQDPSQTQGSTTADHTKISHTEDRKETAQPIDLSQRQGSTTKDHTKISHRQDPKQGAQGQVSHRQASTTEDNRIVSDREDVEETAQQQVSQGQRSTMEDNRKIANRDDGKETAKGRVSHRQGCTAEDNREIANRDDEKEAAHGLVFLREGSTTEDKREEEGLKENRGISIKEDNQLIPKRNKDENRFNNNTTVPEDFRSSDTKEVTTTNPGAINYQITSQSIAQMNPYENNHTASWFPAGNIHTSTPINEATFPFMDQMMDNLYSENVIRNFSVQPAPSGNHTSTTIGNANSILYGMDNYVNDVPQQSFHSTEECNIGNNIKIRISIDSKIPVEISQEQEQHEHMASNSFCKPWQNDTTLTNSLHHGKYPSTEDKGI